MVERKTPDKRKKKTLASLRERLLRWTTANHNSVRRVRLGHIKGEQSNIANLISNSNISNNNNVNVNENNYNERQAWKNQYRDARKGTGNFDNRNFDKGMALNSNMARYMRHNALRAPEFPPNLKRYPRLSSRKVTLFRGFREDFAKLFHRNGFVHSKAYLAFALDRDLAYPYTYDQVRHMRGDDVYPPEHRRALVKLDPLTIPRGTPWLWFDSSVHKNQRPRRPTVIRPSNLFSSTQVVLPPGTLMKAPRPLYHFFERYGFLYDINKFIQRVQASYTSIPYTGKVKLMLIRKTLAIQFPFLATYSNATQLREFMSTVTPATFVLYVADFAHALRALPLADDHMYFVNNTGNALLDGWIWMIVCAARLCRIEARRMQIISYHLKKYQNIVNDVPEMMVFYIPDIDAMSANKKTKIIASLNPKMNRNNTNNLPFYMRPSTIFNGSSVIGKRPRNAGMNSSSKKR